MKNSQFHKWKSRVALCALVAALSVPLVHALRADARKIARGAWSQLAKELVGGSAETAPDSSLRDLTPLLMSIQETVPDDGTIGVLMDELPMDRAQFMLALRILCYPRQLGFYDNLAQEFIAGQKPLDRRVYILDASDARDPYMMEVWKVAATGTLRGGDSFRLLQCQLSGEDH